MKGIFKKLMIGTAAITLVAGLAACSDSEKASGDTKSNYPTKPIEIVVPAGAGGDTDLNTRIMAKAMEKEIGKPLVVTNVTGAGGTAGTQKVNDAKADGYTVLAFHNSIILNKIYGLVDYTYSDMKVAGVGVLDQSNTFLVSKNSEFKTIDELVDYAKANPKKVSVATEVGSMTYMQILQFEEQTGVEFNIVDVGGASDKITALLGGRVDIVPTSLGLVKGYLESGDFVPLGVMAEERLEDAPDIKTFKEQGIDLVVDKVFLWAFPKDTPDDVVATFTEAMSKAVENETYQDEIKKSWLSPVYLNPEEASKKLAEIEAEYEELYKLTEGQ
ncbi:tripartite tricarboxylate transporter substrate binding protein [Sporosarcina luteola]|uniref:tripartite tricarboxylate transporter substrate binding protein n=1 Tax=Sporosarcina luteola TaxID=582850 RepID=UPI00203C5327|nr:tripartite tricarboxylate transporter substrate binding protein [Sporosarcina luteola]MCM3636607.1 tripartite tricarboxylate transporter substrate binding protein [Sporosarcina luteola]